MDSQQTNFNGFRIFFQGFCNKPLEFIPVGISHQNKFSPNTFEFIARVSDGPTDINYSETTTNRDSSPTDYEGEQNDISENDNTQIVDNQVEEEETYHNSEESENDDHYNNEVEDVSYDPKEAEEYHGVGDANSEDDDAEEYYDQTVEDANSFADDDECW